MQTAPAPFVTGELDHLHRLQGSAYTAGSQVWKVWEVGRNLS